MNKKIIFKLSIIIFISINLTFAEQLSDSNNSKYSIKNNPAFSLPTIVVTGYGSKQLFKDTSGTMNIFTADEISRSNSLSLYEVAKKTPGINIADFGVFNFIFIRGVGNLFEFTGKNFAVQVDGMPQLAEAKDVILSDDVERVEILKGPQHILYGANARAGAMDVVLKKPTKSEGSLTLGVGNNHNFTTAINYTSVINDTISLRYGFYRDYSGGYIDNIYLNKKKGGHERKSIYLKGVINPSEKTTIKFDIIKGDTFIDGPVGVQMDFKGNPLKYSLVIPIANIQILKGKSLNFYQVSQDFDGYDNRKTKSYSFKIMQEFAKNSLISYTFSKSKFDSDLAVDFDTTAYEWINKYTLNFFHLKQKNKADNTYHDLKVNTSFDIGKLGSLDLLIGADYNRNYNNRKMTTTSFNINFLFINELIKQRGIYTLLKWKINNNFDLSLGYRRQHDKLSAEEVPFSNNKYINFAYKKALRPVLNFVQDLSYEPNMESKQDLYSATATYHINPKTHIYGTISRGYLSGGFTGLFVPASYFPETGISREIGTKLVLFNDKLFITAAAYSNNYDNYQFINLFTFTIYNLGRVKSNGYEISINYLINPQLSLGMSYSKVDQKTLDSKAHSPLMSNLYIDRIGLVNNVVDFKNKVTPSIPLYNASLNITYAPQLKNDVMLFLTTDIRLTGPTWLDLWNTIKTKKVTVVDASITYKKNNHEVTLWGKNIFNKKYYSAQISAHLFPFGFYAPSRSFGLKYKLKF